MHLILLKQNNNKKILQISLIINNSRACYIAPDISKKPCVLNQIRIFDKVNEKKRGSLYKFIHSFIRIYKLKKKC